MFLKKATGIGKKSNKELSVSKSISSYHLLFIIFLFIFIQRDNLDDGSDDNNDDLISENEIIVLIKLVAVEMSTFLLSEIISASSL